MKKPGPILAFGAALLLPSCIFWSTGDHLRAGCTTYTGVDIYHPVDGKIHYYPYNPHPKKDTEYAHWREAYVLAPEVTYRAQPPSFEIPNIHFIGSLDHVPYPEVEDMKPTGRVVIARIGYEGFREIVPELPKGLLTADALKGKAGWSERNLHIVNQHRNPDKPNHEQLGKIDEKIEKPGVARRALIGTCDYVVDPILNVLTNITIPLVLLPASPFIAMADSVTQQQQTKRDEPPLTSSTPLTQAMNLLAALPLMIAHGPSVGVALPMMLPA